MNAFTAKARRISLLVAGTVAVATVGAACSSNKTTTGASSSGSSSPAAITPASQLTGGGSTFAAPLYTQWATSFGATTHIQVSYNPIGSGAGINAIQAKTVDFGATDAAYVPTTTVTDPIINIPTALGAVVITYNLSGVSKPLQLSGQTIADIFDAHISKWNDAEIAADNPGLSLPSTGITVVHRSDGSGTTNIFTGYLSAVSTSWKAAVSPSSGTTVGWPASEIGQKGSSAVDAYVKQNNGAIGYVELTYALQNHTSAALVKNGAGTYVAPSVSTTAAAAAGLQASSIPAGDNVVFTMLNEPGANAYPICGPTYILAYQHQSDPAKGKALAEFIQWGLTLGQKQEQALDYVALPADIQSRALSAVQSITANGTPLVGPTPTP